METHTSIITFASALFFGSLFMIIANRLKVSAIVLLLLGGIFLGPSSVGLHLINPESLGGGLRLIIQFSVALILFEGGLNLDVRVYRKFSSEIRNALTGGVLVTWILSSLLVKYFMDFDWAFSFMTGSLIIVTGPTVIGPLLKRIGVKKHIHNFLHWEGVLIDPIGVFIALLCYEWIIGQNAQNALAYFFMRIMTGLSIGTIAGLLLAFIIKREWINEESLNVFILSAALSIFAVSDIVVEESGLMSVIIAGLVIGYSDTPVIEKIKVYKSQLIELLIGLLFMLLAANLDIDTMKKYYDMPMLLVFGLIMVMVRPVNIFVSIPRFNKFSLKDKLFLSWIAPRGIVAASMASLFAISLRENNALSDPSQYEFIEAFTYGVICATVFFQGFTAGWVGRIFNVIEPKPTGWLVVGGHALGQTVASYIQKLGRSVTVVDTNIYAIKVSRRNGLTALPVNAMTVNPDNYSELYGIGNVLAVTRNDELNRLICQRWKKLLKKPKLYRWCRPQEMREEKDAFLEEHGRPVWLELQLNKTTSMDMKDNDFPVFIRELDVEKINHPERVLVFSQENKILPFVPESAQGKCSCMVYHPFNVNVDFNIQPEWIIMSEAGSLNEGIAQGLHVLAGVADTINEQAILDMLMEQEREFSSVIGYNISLQHSYIDGVEDSLVAMVKLKKPVLGALNESIEDIFIVLSPKGMPNRHIETLSRISQFVGNEETRRAISSALTERELRAVFFPGE